MCGIIGMAGDGVIDKDLEFMEALMRVSTLRGTHGTGIFQGCFRENVNKKTYFIEKKALEVNQFFRMNQNKLVLGDMYDNVFIGHVRSATRGATFSDANCHPFEKKDIVGVHNGTVHNGQYFSKDKTDSELLYEDISARGHLDVLSGLVKDSAYALSWFNMRTNTLYFARNDKRPLAIVNHKKRNVMYWASELGMLQWMVNRFGFECHPVGYFEVDKVYSIAIDDISTDEVKFGIEQVVHRQPIVPKVRKAKNKNKGRRLTEKEWAAIFNAEPNKNTIVPWTDDRTLALPINLPVIRQNRGKVPHVNCFACMRPLSLWEQYNATALPVDGQMFYECKDCEDLAHKMLEVHKDRVTIN